MTYVVAVAAVVILTEIAVEAAIDDKTTTNGRFSIKFAELMPVKAVIGNILLTAPSVPIDNDAADIKPVVDCNCTLIYTGINLSPMFVVTIAVVPNAVPSMFAL